MAVEARGKARRDEAGSEPQGPRAADRQIDNQRCFHARSRRRGEVKRGE